MRFTPVGWIGYCIMVALEVYGFWRVRQSNLKSLRWLLGFAAVVDLAMLGSMGDRQRYFDWYWYPQMIELTWIAWIAGLMVLRTGAITKWKWVIVLPALTVAWLSWKHIPTTYLTAATMDSYQRWSLAISTATLLIAFISAAVREYIPLALALAALCFLGIGCSALWWLFGYSAETWLLAWIASLVAVLGAATRTAPPHHIGSAAAVAAQL